MSIRILLVDDSPDILFLYRAVLESVPDWEIATAATGREAFELVRSWHPHLMVTDLMMPEMTGLDLITRIRSDLPPPLPRMVAISGFPDLQSEALMRGATQFHLKPILPADLIAVVHQLVGEALPVVGIPDRTAAERLSARQRAEAAVERAILKQPDIPERLRLVAQVTSGYFDELTVAVMLVRDGELRVAASAGSIALQAGAPVREVLALAAHVVESGSRFVVTDLATLPALRLPRGNPLRFLAIVPVPGPDDTIVGGIALLNGEPHPFDATDLTIVEHIARWGTIAASSSARRVMFAESGLLQPESWRTWLSEEMTHIRAGAVLGVSLVEPDDPRHINFEQVRTLWHHAPPRTAFAELEKGVIAAYSVAPELASVERRLDELHLATQKAITGRCGSIVHFVNAHLPNEADSVLEIAGDALASARTQKRGTVVRMFRGDGL